MTGTLTPELIEDLAGIAAEAGVLRLGAVSLTDPGFGRAGDALDRFLAEGKAGDMGYLERAADVRKDPSKMLGGARSLLVGAVPYGGTAGPIARYAQGADYHSVLHRRLDPVVAALRSRLPDVDAMVCVDTKPIMERAAAALAGLGFIGKHGCVIVPGLGSYVLLGAILCTASVAPQTRPDDAKILWDACGSCRRCLDACPTDAFEAPGDLDPRRCISYLTIEYRGHIDDALADRLGERVAGCDVCQEVCPYNAGNERIAKAPAHAWLEPPVSGVPEPELPRLATIGSSRYRAFVRDTALRRIPRRAMQRNALIAIGNREAALTPEETDAIEAGHESDAPVVREAASRARGRRGLT